MKFSTPSPCKLNLFLDILGRREDGYHELQTLFVVLNYGDELCFSDIDQGFIDISPSLGLNPEDNLIYKAAVAIRYFAKNFYPLKITVKKVIPLGGGLGGGSSNAATTLLVLNQLWNCGLTQQQLIDLGVKLGADVPIFIKGVTCLARGIGERLEQVDYPQRYYLVCTPLHTHIETRRLFAHPDLKRDCPYLDYEHRLRQPFDNCVTPLVIKLYPSVASLFELLQSRYQRCYLSGTGSSLFVDFQTQAQAQQALDLVKNEPVSCFIAASLDHNCVIQKLKQLHNTV